MLIELNTQTLAKFHDTRNFMTPGALALKLKNSELSTPTIKRENSWAAFIYSTLFIFSRLEIMILLWNVEEGQRFWYAAAPSVELCADSDSAA